MCGGTFIIRFLCMGGGGGGARVDMQFDLLIYSIMAG